MAAEEHAYAHAQTEGVSMRYLLSGSIGEGAAGAAAVVVSIAGLAAFNGKTAFKQDRLYRHRYDSSHDRW